MMMAHSGALLGFVLCQGATLGDQGLGGGRVTTPGLPGFAAGCRMMALLELPALRGFSPSDASANRLHELLHSRFKIEVRGAAQ